MASKMIVSSRTVLRYLSQKTSKSLGVNHTLKQGQVFKEPIIHSRSLTVLADKSENIKSNFAFDSNLNGSSCFIRKLHTSPTAYGEITTVSTPAFADSISEGDVKFLKEIGDSVVEDETVAEIETDKTSLEVKAPGNGVVTEFLVEDGSTVTAHTAVFKMEMGAAGSAKPAPTKDAAPSPPPPPPQAESTESSGPIPTSPPPEPAKPTAPMATKPAAAVKPQQAARPVAMSGERVETRVKMNRMRQRIAVRLKEAQNTCAMLTTFNEIDMSNVMEMRASYKDAFLKKHGLKLGFMSAFLKASANALMTMPEVNAVIDEGEIVYRDYADISVAVATPKGLVVPVLRDAHAMSYADIERGLSELGEKARLGQLAVEDMDGGTFTVSNGGVFGSMFGTPIINPPQSAILGMHGIFERPVAIKGKVEVRPMMYVALTYDHRLIDGREAVLFLRKIKSAVEDPRTLLMEL